MSKHGQRRERRDVQHNFYVSYVYWMDTVLPLNATIETVVRTIRQKWLVTRDTQATARTTTKYQC